MGVFLLGGPPDRILENPAPAHHAVGSVVAEDRIDDVQRVPEALAVRSGVLDADHQHRLQLLEGVLVRQLPGGEADNDVRLRRVFLRLLVRTLPEGQVLGIDLDGPVLSGGVLQPVMPEQRGQILRQRVQKGFLCHVRLLSSDGSGQCAFEFPPAESHRSAPPPGPGPFHCPACGGRRGTAASESWSCPLSPHTV